VEWAGRAGVPGAGPETGRERGHPEKDPDGSAGSAFADDRRSGGRLKPYWYERAAGLRSPGAVGVEARPGGTSTSCGDSTCQFFVGLSESFRLCSEGDGKENVRRRS